MLRALGERNPAKSKKNEVFIADKFQGNLSD